MKKFVTLLALSVLWAMTPLPASALAVPITMPFQGRLTDAAGVPLSGTFSIRFSLWNLATAGAEQWNETHPFVTVTNGIFRVDLGLNTGLTPTILNGADRFLEIKVGADAAMTPRQHLGSTAYAFRAGDSPGIAANHATGAAGAVGSTFNTCSQAVTYPGPGVAIVTTWVSWETDNPPNAGAQHQLGISQASGAFDGQTQYFAILSATAASAYTANVTSLVRVYNIAAAGAATYFTVVYRQIGSLFHLGTYMTVQFFPNTIGTITSEPAAVPTFSTPTRASEQAKTAPR